MIAFGLVLLAIIVLTIFLGTIIFMGSVVFGANKLGFKKLAKYLAIAFLSIIFFGAFLLIYDVFKEDKKSKDEIKKIISNTNLKLNDDFEIVKQKEDWDLTYSKIDFILKISDKDFKDLENQYPNKIIRDSIKNIKPDDYDTLKVKIDNSKNLYFYRSHHNFDN